jgi:hypothetical protein
MTVSLLDISTATADYIENHVEVGVGRVTGNLQADEEGTYTVRVTNDAAPNGIRLTQVTLHITVSPGTVASLRPPTGLLVFARASANSSDPLLGRDDEVSEMFVFFIGPGVNEEVDGILDVGELLELEFGYRAKRAGNATITCHIHASIEVDDLFPRSAGSNGTVSLQVIPG